ncbi:aminomethyl-transferring glycine dehydrogenase subunit GcvPA [candidate division KSB1 bacterium]
MSKNKPFTHPYIPNSAPAAKEAMLKEIGVKSIDEFYEDIPENLRFKGKMNLPEPLLSEYELKRHVENILSKNRSCKELINFLGGGCYQHYVPAICDEINQRSEFLTGYAGEPYEDHGRFQSLFEYASLMGELLDMDVVNLPTYDWGQAVSTSILMTGRITGRSEILISESISPERELIINNYCRSGMKIDSVKFDKETGLINLDDLKEKMSKDTAGIYLENPTFFGNIEHRGDTVSDIIHENGGLLIVGADPLSLGILTPPVQYGADIVCGSIQGLGVHMQYGGGLAGFIAVRDEERFVAEYPSRLFGITKTDVPGEWGFGDVLYDRTSFGVREQGKEFVGTMSALWGITAGVYLALAGPHGMQKLGKTILQKSQYAMKKLSEIDGVKIRFAPTPHFKEFVVDFSRTGKPVKDINNVLLDEGISGGLDLSQDFPGMENCALYCVTEVHTKEDLDKLADTLNKCLNQK